LWFYPIIGAAIAAGQRRGRQWLIGRSEMSRRAMTVLMALLCLLSALNAIALVFNISLPSRAAVGGMSYEDLSAIKILHVRSSRSHRNAGLMSISLS
jgi:hypothetical protein